MVWLIALPFGQASPRSTVLLTVPFAVVDGSTVHPASDISVDNGAQPHDATHYLAKARVGASVVQALGRPSSGA